MGVDQVKRYAILLALVLAGCASTQPIERVQPVEVKVPVVVQIPEPKQTVRPDLMIYQLKESDSQNPGKVIQYYQASIKQLQGYAVELETIIDGYRQAAKAQQENK